MSERCKQMSKKTNEWPSTYISIHGCSKPQCTAWFRRKDVRTLSFMLLNQMLVLPYFSLLLPQKFYLTLIGKGMHYVDAHPVYVRKSPLKGQKFVKNCVNNNLERSQVSDKGKTFVGMTTYYVKNVQRCYN